RPDRRGGGSGARRGDASGPGRCVPGPEPRLRSPGRAARGSAPHLGRPAAPVAVMTAPAQPGPPSSPGLEPVQAAASARFPPAAPVAVMTAPAQPGTPSATGLDPMQAAAYAAFTQRYGAAALGPICIVIPAFREVGSIGGVLAEVPAEIAGERVATLVVVDGE